MSTHKTNQQKWLEKIAFDNKATFSKKVSPLLANAVTPKSLAITYKLCKRIAIMHILNSFGIRNLKDKIEAKKFKMFKVQITQKSNELIEKELKPLYSTYMQHLCNVINENNKPIKNADGQIVTFGVFNEDA